MFHIVLFNPKIPQNTGCIGRICVNTSSSLHIVKPIGFEISDKYIKKSGMDYWSRVELYVYENLDEFFKLHKDSIGRMFFLTTKSKKEYFKNSFSINDYIIFGSEDRGIDEAILDRYKKNTLTLPMTSGGRSLNLAVSVGIVLYDAIRQNYSYFKDFC